MVRMFVQDDEREESSKEQKRIFKMIEKE